MPAKHTQKYNVNPQHRKASFAGAKSQWTITENEERAVFDTAVETTTESLEANTDAPSEDTAVKNYWGLHLVNSKAKPLGITPSNPKTEPVSIAKFVRDDRLDIWHGYPIAHWVRTCDKPDELVLKIWQAAEYINKPTFSKIHRGKRCTL